MTEIFAWLSEEYASLTNAPRQIPPGLIAVSEQCDWPGTLASLPRAGSMLMPDYERILRMKPDIILASFEGNPPALGDFVKRMDIPLYAARIDSLPALYAALSNFSRLFFPDQGMPWTDRLQEKRHALKGKLTGQRVFFQIGLTDQAWSFGKNTLLHDLITLAGGENLGAAHPGSFPRFDAEALARIRPSLVVLLSGSAYARDTAFWEKYAPGVRILSARADAFERPGPRLFAALRDMDTPKTSGGAP
jgi:ABC-type Fe3+-hydroxamate transport system substrate-binding protein